MRNNCAIYHHNLKKEYALSFGEFPTCSALCQTVQGSASRTLLEPPALNFDMTLYSMYYSYALLTIG